MKRKLLAAAFVVTAAMLQPALAGSWNAHPKYNHTAGEACEMLCGKVDCFDAKNQSWRCNTKTGKTIDCKWERNGLCVNKYNGKDLENDKPVTPEMFPNGTY